MDYLGLFCLGAFVGAIATIGVRFIDSLDNWGKVLALTLPTVLSGIAVVFVDKFKYSPAFGCYPLGLLVALLWAYSDQAVAKIQSSQPSTIRLGYAHLVAALVITAAAGTAVTLPAIWQLQDEYNRPIGEILKGFEEQQLRAKIPSSPA